MTDQQAKGIERTLGELSGKMDGLGKGIHEVREDQRLMINEVQQHGCRLAAIEQECRRRGDQCSQRFNKQSAELNGLRDCTGRITIEQEKRGVQWLVLLKIVGLLLGGGGGTAFLMYLLGR